jgi:hypothetical protein
VARGEATFEVSLHPEGGLVNVSCFAQIPNDPSAMRLFDLVAARQLFTAEKDWPASAGQQRETLRSAVTGLAGKIDVNDPNGEAGIRISQKRPGFVPASSGADADTQLGERTPESLSELRRTLEDCR